MKNTTQARFVTRATTIAIRAALVTMAVIPAAYAADAAEDPAVTALVRPTNVLEAGVGYVSDDSFKFGEYNGLQDKGAFGIGNFDIRGGDPFDSPGTFRYRAFGRDLGLDTRTIGGEIGNQGSFRLRYIYDELRRNFSDSYQTFYRGAGSDRLDIPAFANVPAASRLSSTATAVGALSNWQNIQAPYATAACATTGGVPSAACAGPGYLIPPAMQPFDVDTKRKKHDLDFVQELLPNVELKASVKHEEKDGTKLTGVAFGGPARGVLVPEPIRYQTDYFRASVGWVGEQSFATIGYTGSKFKDNTNLWVVENPFNGNLLQPDLNNFAHMSGAPDNEMHQITLSGGYNFNRTTRLVLTGNYQRMTQDEPFVPTSAAWTLPESSPHAKVVNTSFSATFTSKPMRDLSLLAQYKYEDRDNKTASLNWFVTGGEAAGATSLFTNRPLNFKTNQATLEGDYAIGNRQAIKIGYDWKQIERTVTATPPPPAELEAPFDAEKTTDNTFRIEYRNTMSQVLTGRLMYAYSHRHASEYEQEELLPTNPPAPFPAADAALPGFKQFWLVDRDRNKAKGVLNAQVNEATALNASLEYNDDRYKDLTYGLKKVTAFVANLDGSYALNERMLFNAYYTFEDRKSEMNSLVIGRGNSTTILDAPAFTNPCSGYFAATGHLPSDLGTDPCRQWFESQTDRVHTFGIGALFRGLGSDRFDLSGNLTYQYAKTPVTVTGGAYFGNGSTAAAPAFNNIFIAAQPFPDITTKLLQLRLDGNYALSNNSALHLLYIYGRLRTQDWQWDAYTNSALGVLAVPTYPGTAITSPDYNVHVVGLSYVYRWQ